MSTRTQQAFEAKMKKISSTAEPPAAPWYWEILHARQKGRCIFCGAAANRFGGHAGAAQVHQVVPGSHGGASLELNLVLACGACVQEREGRDWLDWGKAVDPQAMAQQRLLAMRHCTLMHYTKNPEGSRTELGAKARLSKRWAHPRSTVLAFCSPEGGYFGIREAMPTPVLGFLLNQAGAVRVSPGVWRVEPETFVSVCWQLIEANTWVKRVRLDDVDDVDLSGNPLEAQWWCVVRSAKEVADRRGRQLPPMNGRGEAKLRKRLRDTRMKKKPRKAKGA